MLIDRGKTAVVYKGESYSYLSLLQHINLYAQTLHSYPVSQKVLIYAENSVEWIFVNYATWKNNGIVIPVDVQSPVNELVYILNDVSPDIIFTSDDKIEVVRQALHELNLPLPVLTVKDFDLSGVDQYPADAIIPMDNKRTAYINYTSGTTGFSKGVMLSFENLYFIVNAVCDDIRIFRPEYNTMILLPLHHILPLMGSMVAPLYSGGTIYIAEGLATDSILKTLQEGKIGIIIGVPRLYEALAKGILSKIEEKNITKTIYKIVKKIHWRRLSKIIFGSVHKKFGGHLRFLVSGGAALPVETGEIFKTLGFEILEGYGMTEMAPLISFTHPGKWTVGYAGYPLKGMDLKIVDGEICVKGPNMMQGYYNKPVETAEAIIDGWLHTGDIGFIDKYGLKLTGRKKEIIVTSNGKNIDPFELETKLLKTSSYIKEVGIFMHDGMLQALILPDMNEVRNSSKEIHELFKEVILLFNDEQPSYKRLKGFYIVSEELPRTRMGKLQRFKLPDLVDTKKEERENENERSSERYQLLKVFVENETKLTANEYSHFEIDLGMDSLSRVALLAYVETTFGVPLSESDLNTLNTLGKLDDYIEANQEASTVYKKLEWKDILTAKMSNMTLPHSGFTSKTLNFIIRYLLRIVYRYKSQGTSNIPEEPCIFVANHQSMLDGVLITSTLERKINKKTYLFAKAKYWKNKVMAYMAEKNNVILMDINSNLKEAIQKLSFVLRSGKNIIIFPEGTRSKEGLQPFKEMFAILSKELNVPVVPIVLYGTDRAVYRKILFPRYFTKIAIEFLDPVYPKPEESYFELTNKVRDMIVQKLELYKKNMAQKKN